LPPSLVTDDSPSHTADEPAAPLEIPPTPLHKGGSSRRDGNSPLDKGAATAGDLPFAA